MADLLNHPDGDVRGLERRPYAKTLEYSLKTLDLNGSKGLALKGNILNINDKGMCIQTDHPLEPGDRLWFNDGVERSGIVRWCIRVDNTYRAGIQLETDRGYVDLEAETNGVPKDLSISEDRERYCRLLDVATEEFNRRLEGIEKRCLDPKESPDRLLGEVSIALTDISYLFEEFEEGVHHDKSVIKDAQVRFRERTDPILSKSYCIHRARTWPQGYQGDYKTLEIIYRNTPLSEGIGYYLDLFILNTPLAEAVRNRIKMVEEILREEISKRERPSVLNIACGSCREVMGLYTEIKNSEARFICVDNDNDAIAFAQGRLSYVDLLPHVEIYKYNALRMFDHESNMLEFGMQDIIYSVGFFDYLPDDFLVKMLNALYRLLNPGGRLIAAFKDASRYRYHGYHWIVDWDGFLQRTVADFERLFHQAGIPEDALSVSREKSGVIIFYIVTK